MTHDIKKANERRDERNLARFGIISMLSRMDSNEKSWTVEFMVEDRQYRVECVAPHGRPHGIDAAVIAAIQTLFVAQKCPEHNWVHTTIYEVRELSGLSNNGLSHERVKESIKRLWSTGFIVYEGWYDPFLKQKFKNTDSLRYLERFQFHETSKSEEDVEALPGMRSNTTLSIKLGDQLADSIRLNHTLNLDGNLLLKLEQPPAWALYRLLEAHRLQSDGTRLNRLTVSLENWRQACGIVQERPDLVRKVLNPAHDELMAKGYLESAAYEGRGREQKVTYVFSTEDSADVALVRLLIDAGVSKARAVELAKTHSDRVEEAIEFVRRRNLEKPVRNPGGMIADVLTHPEKYETKPAQGPLFEMDSMGKVQQAMERIQESEQAAARELEETDRKLLQLSPPEQYQQCKAHLKIFLEKSLSKKEFSILEEACQAGLLLAGQLKVDMAHAAATRELPGFVDRLKETLASFATGDSGEA